MAARSTSISFGQGVAIWDDLELTRGGTLSEIAFTALNFAGGSFTGSGEIDLRVFN